MSDDSEQFRHECECKYWLDVTGGDKLEIENLMERITKKRGQAAADRLRQGMRDEFLRRRSAQK